MTTKEEITELLRDKIYDTLVDGDVFRSKKRKYAKSFSDDTYFTYSIQCSVSISSELTPVGIGAGGGGRCHGRRQN